MAESPSISTDQTCSLLRARARIYAQGLSEASVRDSFSAFIERSGTDGMLLQYFFPARSSNAAVERLLRFLGIDNSPGTLKLDDFIVLHYIKELQIPYCDLCGKPMITGGQSCTDCPPPCPAAPESSSPALQYILQQELNGFVNATPCRGNYSGTDGPPTGNIPPGSSFPVSHPMKQQQNHLADPPENATQKLINVVATTSTLPATSAGHGHHDSRQNRTSFRNPAPQAARDGNIATVQRKELNEEKLFKNVN